MGDDGDGDVDNDGLCEDGTDQCPGGPDNADLDGDTVPDASDLCPLDNPDDSDDDGVCESDDICPNSDVARSPPCQDDRNAYQP